MATPRKPRTRKPANSLHIDLVPMEPKRRRKPRQPTTYVMDMSQPIQHTSPDAAWVTTQIVEATVNELSKVSLADAATIIRAAVKGQPIDVAPVARLAVLGLLNLGLVVYDYLAPPSNPPPPRGKRSPIS
jgi:hypothetical protein